MTDAISAPAEEAGVIVTAETNTELSENDALGAVWDKYERDNGAARGSDGKFAASSGAQADAGDDVASQDNGGPLEGGEGGENEDAGSPPPASSVPLPANWTGLDDHWAKIPPESQEVIAASQKKIHQTLSDQGRYIAAFRPVGDVFSEFKEYFGGDRGNYKPEDAVRTLFTIQRDMDDDPIATLLKIADTYEVRDKLAEAFGAQATAGGEHATAQQPDQTRALLAEINELKRTISGLSDPSKIDQRISQKIDEERTLASVSDLISRTSKDMPLYDDVESELPEYITKAWAKLGESASQDAVLKYAYDMAVHADPDLRKKAAALTSAAQTDPKLLENARKANATNIRSTSTGKAREMTEEELLGAIFDKHKRA